MLEEWRKQGFSGLQYGRLKPWLAIRATLSMAPPVQSPGVLFGEVAMRFRRLLRVGVTVLAMNMAIGLVQAADDDVAAIQTLIDAGKTDQAVALIDARLLKVPGSFQLRYLKAISLLDKGSFVEASYLFDALIKDFPQVAELYNNRGVAHVNLRKYEKGVQDFEKAIRLNPQYAMAYQNLGLLYAVLAEVALGEAQGLDRNNSQLAVRYTQLKNFNATQGPAAAPVAVQGAEATKAAAPNTVMIVEPPARLASATVEPTPTPVAAQANEVVVAAQDAAQLPALPLSSAEPNVVAPAEVTEATVSGTPTEAAMTLLPNDSPPAIHQETLPALQADAAVIPASDAVSVAMLPSPTAVATNAPPTAMLEDLPAQTKPVNTTENVPSTLASGKVAAPELGREAAGAVADAVEAWRTAWAGKDMNAYFAAYSPTFKPANGMKPAEWKADRQKKIALRPDAISIAMTGLSVGFRDDGMAEVRYNQTYRAGSLDMRDRKYLLLSRQGGAWLIEAEKVVP